MKKLSNTRILVLVLSLVLIACAAFVVSASAEETAPKGSFGSISVAYGDKVSIQVVVNATEEEINNGDVVVTYSIGGVESDATYFRTDDKGRVWVVTEGIAAYNLAEVVTFNSYVGDEQVESNRTYSVAQFLYKMLYTNSSLTPEYKSLYESLIAYGKAAQIALNINADKLVTDSTLVYTANADVKFGGASSVFAPAAGANVTPTYNGTIPVGKELEGWNIIDDGEEKVVGLTFDCAGVVEVVSPILADMDPTIFTLANGGFENGMEGWTVVGNIGGVSMDTHYWVGDPESAEGFAFGMDGEHMFSAYAPGASEGAVGTLTSSNFIVGGSGYVTFKLGAMRDGNYVYVDVVDAETKQILARYYNGLWAERTDGVKSGCTLVAYKADLSAFLGKEVFFRVSDNANAGYGLFFVDSFNTYYTSEPQGFNVATPVGYDVSGTTIYDLFNGGFEMGGVQGWWNDGTIGEVTDIDGYWNENYPYGKDGNYLFSGVQNHGQDFNYEANRGLLTSSVFEIGGTGYISFMLGGGGHPLCFVQVIDAATGEVLVRYHQQAMEDAKLKTYVADLSAYIGRTARVQVVDQAQNGWGCVSFDNVVTYYPADKALPEGAITANDIYEGLTNQITNGSFENGLEGWNTYDYEGGSIGNVTSTEPESEWYTKNDGIKDGNNLFAFWWATDTNNEGGKGTLTSSLFRLESGSVISFKFGGAGGGINHDVWVELVSADGTVIARFFNDAEGKQNTKMNAYFYEYTGAEVDCFIRAVDNSNSNYGGLILDAFQVTESAPEGYLPAME